MIIQIRGTSGSGKSTAMRDIMGMIGDWNSVTVPKRKRPLYYEVCEGQGWPPMIVLGHYESACGGCDTIGSARAVYDLIQTMSKDRIILAEGLLLSEDVKWSSQLPDLTVYYLQTPVEQCLKQIGQRRSEAGNEKELNPANTINRVPVIERSRVKLSAVGVRTVRCTVDQCVRMTLQQLRLHAQHGG